MSVNQLLLQVELQECIEKYENAIYWAERFKEMGFDEGYRQARNDQTHWGMRRKYLIRQLVKLQIKEFFLG